MELKLESKLDTESISSTDTVSQLDITNISNNIYSIDLIIFYCENNNINNIEYTKLELQDHILSQDNFKTVLSELKSTDYTTRYILEFYIDNNIEDIIYSIDNTDDNYNYKLNTITKITDLSFTNKHFLNTLVIVLDKKLKPLKQANNTQTNNTQTMKNINKKNNTKKIKLK